MAAASDYDEGAPAELEGEEGGMTIQISEEEAAAFFEVAATLRRPLDPAEISADDELVALEDPPTLEQLIEKAGAPVRVEEDAVKGRRLVATRSIPEGEVIFREQAVAWALSRSPGSEGVYSMSAKGGGVIATLPQWAALRTLRDTLTFAPEWRGHGEAAYRLLTRLTAYNRGDHIEAGWGDVAEWSPGIERTPENAIPPRVHLLHAIAQCNAFSVSLPEEDSDWKRGLLWPMLGRMQVPEDRERAFEDPQPLSWVSSFFILGGLINHSCDPNTRYTQAAWAEGEDAPEVVFVAARDIAEGEELQHAYYDPTEPAEERRRKLQLTYRFVCTCPKCTVEVPELAAAAAAGGGAAVEGTPVDPLTAEGNFAHGVGLDGLMNFYAMGGAYPREVRAPVVEEGDAEEEEAAAGAAAGGGGGDDEGPPELVEE